MNYKTHIFDCDGVLLRSNAAKSRAFYEAALPYGKGAADAMVAYHQSAGSVSREDRWRHFFASILKREPYDGELARAIADCTERVRSGIAAAEVMPGVREYLERCETTICVSGVDQAELVEILGQHGLRFNQVYGGPRRKRYLLTNLVREGNIEFPAVYYGDTKDDYQAAFAAQLDFVFVAGDSEWHDWETFFGGRSHVMVIDDFTGLLEMQTPITGDGSGESLEPIAAGRQKAAKARVSGKARVDHEGFIAGSDGERRYVGRELAGAEVVTQ